MHTDKHIHIQNKHPCTNTHTHKYACETHGVDLQKNNFLHETHASTHSPNTHTHPNIDTTRTGCTSFDMYKVEESGGRTETNHVSLMNFGPLTNSTTQCGDFSLLSTQNKKENLNVKKHVEISLKLF